MHLAVADDDGTVVQGGAIKKQITQQLAGQQRVDLNAGLDIITQLGVALDYDQSTAFFAGQITGRLGQHTDGCRN